MANSDGGLIIYGIKESSQDKHLPESIDPIDRSKFSKEWLDQIIQSKIRPRIDNCKIYPIEIGSDQGVYVIDVEKSNTAHQAADKRYYKRFNSRCEPMYDYEIRDILNRSKNPIVDLKFELRGNSKRLKVYAENSGNVYAKYVNVILLIPNRCLAENKYDQFDTSTTEIAIDNTVRDVIDTQLGTGIPPTPPKHTYGPARHQPILPKQRMRLKVIDLAEYATDPENIISWKLYCDNNEPKEGEIRIQDALI